MDVEKILVGRRNEEGLTAQTRFTEEKDRVGASRRINTVSLDLEAEYVTDQV